MTKLDNSLKLLRPFILLSFIFLFTGSGCATDRKVKQIIERADSSCDLSHLGKNKLFYSHKYQRHLSKNIGEIKRKYRR